VTAPLYLVPRGALDGLGAGSVVLLDGAEGRHAATVRRARVGERIDVGDGAGVVARGVVEAVSKDEVGIRVEALDTEPAAGVRLVLVQALAKGGRDELAVETATELGVDAVIPWQAARCVVVWSGDRGEKSRRRWDDTVRAAVKQSRRATLPPVEPPVTTLALVSRTDQVLTAGGAVLVLHEDAELPLAETPLPVPSAGDGSGGAGAGPDVLVVVGPEGGIAGSELEQLTRTGAQAVRLGPQVLRSSSAGAAALAVLSARLGRWR
jgi:16S rRNA (uracil1498-N3)-methyltransferase